MALQKRLSSLGYWIATVDGRFGDSTQQAVIAFQKVANISRDGIVGPQTAAALQRAVRPAARPGLVDGVEIDLSRQVLLLVRDGIVMLALNTSTGSGATYWSRGHLNVAVTPRGRFAVYRQVDGADVSPLGVLWRPKYFTQGIAIHGYADVPAYPASHGCVRVSFAAMNYLWATGLLPIGTPVWVV
jgi:N-acetylmuramoyl-L-alanine amidase